jgi:hypothetical protein
VFIFFFSSCFYFSFLSFFLYCVVGVKKCGRARGKQARTVPINDILKRLFQFFLSKEKEKELEINKTLKGRD